MNESEISPCIVSQVRNTLSLKAQPVNNDKTSSDDYWNETVEIVGTYYNVPRQTKRNAKRNI